MPEPEVKRGEEQVVLTLSDSQREAVYNAVRRLDANRPNNEKIGTLEGMLYHWINEEEEKFIQVKEKWLQLQAWFNGLSFEQQMEWLGNAPTA